MSSVEEVLATVGDEELEARWSQLASRLEARFRQTPGLESMLFLIGIQSRGAGYQPELEKEAKQDLIMEGTYQAFSALGLYEYIQGAWRRTSVRMGDLSVADQEKLLRLAVVTWFDRHFPEI